MREMMVAPPGSMIVGADYAALEARIAALLAGQKDLIEAFNEGLDIHSRHAGWFFGDVWEAAVAEWEAADQDDEKAPGRKLLRDRSKNVYFGKIYGAGVEVLYEQIREKLTEIKTPEEHRKLKAEVAAMSRILDKRYPNTVKWGELMHKMAREANYLHDPFGNRLRKWPMGEVPSLGIEIPATECRNHAVQPAAAWIINQATFRLVDWLVEQDLYRNGVWVILQVHDALYLEVEEEYVDLMRGKLEELMGTSVTYESLVTGESNTMQFTAEASIGRSVADV
jgi:DNA polymerase-1